MNDAEDVNSKYKMYRMFQCLSTTPPPERVKETPHSPAPIVHIVSRNRAYHTPFHTLSAFVNNLPQFLLTENASDRF